MCTPYLQSTARAFSDFWTTQDETNVTARANLLPSFESAVTTPNADPYSNVPSTQSFTEAIDSDEMPDADAVVQPEHVPQFEQLAVSRMLTGAAPAISVSSADIYRITSGSVDFETEFPALFLKKKNRASTGSSWISFIKYHDSFTFPAASNCSVGMPLRGLLTALTGQIQQEYNPPLLALSIGLVESLAQSSHSSDVHLCFQKSLSLSTDEEILLFETNCANGVVDTAGIKTVHPAMQPGFARYTQGPEKVIWWNRFATAVINRLCFENIRQLEGAFNLKLKKWQNFKISSIKIARSADAVELILFADVENAAAACGEVVPAEIQRVSGHLLNYLFITAKKHISYIVSKKKMAKASITRSFFFKELNEFISREDHSLKAVEESLDTDLICQDCSADFVFTGAEKFKFANKLPVPWSDPSRCKSCQQKRFEQKQAPLTALPIDLQPAEPITPGEKKIECKNCRQTFKLSPDQVQWYSSQVDKDGTPWVLPKSCDTCRHGREKNCMLIVDGYDVHPGDMDDRDDDEDIPRGGILLEESDLCIPFNQDP